MSPNDQIEELRQVLKILGDGLPSILNSVAEMAFDPKRVAAFATSTAEFYRQLREAGVPEDKAADLTKVFIERTNPMGPLGAMFGGSGAGGLEDLGALFGAPGASRGKVVFKVGNETADQDEDHDKAEDGRGERSRGSKSSKDRD